MVDISRKTYDINDEEKIEDNDGILWLNEKLIEDRLDHKYLWVITVKYLSGRRTHRYELVDEPNKQTNRFICINN